MTCIFSRISGLQQAPNKATWESFFSLPSFYISLKSTQIVLQCSVWMRKSQLTTERRTERVVMDLEQWKSGLIDSTMRNFHIWISFQECYCVSSSSSNVFFRFQKNVYFIHDFAVESLTHYSKSQIFVQKFNFDKTPTFSRVFHPNFFWQFFSWNQSCQQLKSPKPQHFHDFFTPKVDNFHGKSSWISGQKMKISNSVLKGTLQ